MPLISTHDLVITRPGARPLSYPDITLEKGTPLLLTGSSGCGKTSLLSAIAGLLPPSAGAIRNDAGDIYEMSPRARDQWRGKQIGFIFQSFHLVPSLTVRQNVALAASMAGLKTDEQYLEALLARLKLSHLRDKRPHRLSQGEKQRTAIARAVLNKPSLFIADEPTSSLDDENTSIIVDILQDCAKETGAALLVATHDHRLLKYFSRTLDLAQPGKALAA